MMNVENNRFRSWIVAPAVCMLLAGCGEADLIGFHSNHPNLVAGGWTMVLLNLEGRAFDCHQPADGAYLGFFARGNEAGAYSHYTGQMDDIPSRQFQAVSSERRGDASINKKSSRGGSLTLDSSPAGGSLTGSVDVTFDGATVSAAFSTSSCGFTP